MDNPETLVTLGTQDTGQINVRENRRLFSLTFICPVSCVPNVTSVSGLSIIDCSFGFL
jgi:hypothetical protein